MANESDVPQSPANSSRSDYGRFFKPGQKVFLRTSSTDDRPPKRLESLTAFLKEYSAGYIDLFLPYKVLEGEHLPFVPGQVFELTSGALGLGLRLRCEFAQDQGRDCIRLGIISDLQVFQNRFTPRIDMTAGLRYTRGLGPLRTFREQWEKNIQILSRTPMPANLSNFPRTRINLSSSGIRFTLKAPVETGSLCLILLEVEKTQTPICTLAEVLWAGEIAQDRQAAGMRFINILESDQRRIDEVVRLGDAVAEKPEEV